MSNQNPLQKQGIETPSDSQNGDANTRNQNLPQHVPESVRTSSPSSEEAPDLDEIFDLLKNYRRRCVLRYLSTVEGTAQLSDIAEQISGWENDKEPRLITSSERKRVYVGLYQSHLPKMSNRGAISFNKPRGIVEKGPFFEHFHHYLPAQGESSESVGWRIYNKFVGKISSIFI
jgi:hypothetical protein